MHADEPVDNDLELLSQYFVMPSPQSTVMPMAPEGPMPQMDMPAVSQRPKGAPERELAARIITRFGTDQPDEGHSDDAPSASSQQREQLRQRLDLVISNNAATLQHYDARNKLFTKLLDGLATPSKACPDKDHSQPRKRVATSREGLASILASVPNIRAESPKDLFPSQRISSGGFLPRAASLQYRHYASRKMWQLFDPPEIEFPTFQRTTWAPNINETAFPPPTNDLLPACFQKREYAHAPIMQTRSGKRKLGNAVNLLEQQPENQPEIESVIAHHTAGTPPPLEPAAPSTPSDLPATPPSVMKFRERTLKDTIIEMPQNECTVKTQPAAVTVPSEPTSQSAAAEDQPWSGPEKKRAKMRRKSLVANSSAKAQNGAQQSAAKKNRKPRAIRRF